MEVWIARMNITVRIACGAAADWPQFDVVAIFSFFVLNEFSFIFSSLDAAAPKPCR